MSSGAPRTLHMSPRYVIALLFATVCATAAAGALLAASAPESQALTRSKHALRPFATTSFWNSSLPDSEPLDKRSDVYVDRLNQLLDRWDPYVNTVRWSTPVYTVPRDQRRVRVHLDNTQEPLRKAFESVPVPRRARASRGTDHHMVVWQPSTDTMWEFWIARRLSDGWHARYGGRMRGRLEEPGVLHGSVPALGCDGHQPAAARRVDATGAS